MFENVIPFEAPATRGGMDKNPFGGNTRLDRLDLFDFAGGTDDGMKLLYLKVISDAASDYLFFALGKNGTVADDFWAAVEYFFTCRSTEPSTWQDARYMRNTYVDEATGKRQTTTLVLTDEELKIGCFDHHYEMSGLADLMPMDMFIDWLRTRREEILKENALQVHNYVDLLQRTALRRLPEGTQVPFKLDSVDRMQVLSSPESPEQVAEMIYYSPRRRTSSHKARHVSRPHRENIVTMSRHRAVPVEGQMPFQLAS